MKLNKTQIAYYYINIESISIFEYWQHHYLAIINWYKKILFSTILLFIFTFELSAQTKIKNDNNDEKARTLIEHAKEYADKKLFTLAVDNLQKTYSVNKDIFNCQDFCLMGISY